MNESSFNLIHLPAMAKVDVHVVCRSDFGRTQLARRQCKQVSRTEPLDIFVTSAEDTILAKLVADRQPREVVGAIKMQAGALDRAYLRDWAGRLNLTDLLRRAIDDAGLPPDS